MGARGPAPTPTPILEARGSWRAKERPNEPRLPVRVPSCPPWLSTEGKAEWRRQTRHLKDMGCITEADRAMLAAYCEAWGEFVALTYRIGELAKDDIETGYALCIQSGLLAAKNKAVERMAKLAAQFGFSPSARTRLQCEKPQEQDDGGKSRFFKSAGAG